MRIHLVALGGSVMHNLALDLAASGHVVSGSDDEFYEPSRSRLLAAGLLPEQTGWDPDRIDRSIDCVITGMHARKDNPEINRALELGIRVYSFPEFYGERCQDKLRIVVAGSHGKTTTTAMIMHALSAADKDFDYLVGASLEGFERNVRLSTADLCVIEGDEYLSSPLDPRPKIMHYDPDVAIITGIAWDHMNVFPSWESYMQVFKDFVSSMRQGTTLIWFMGDPVLKEIVSEYGQHLKTIPYAGLPMEVGVKNQDMAHLDLAATTRVFDDSGSTYVLKVFGGHNMQNMSAAQLACAEIGISQPAFLKSMETFKGASMRLQLLVAGNEMYVYRDFAHAPSKARATVEAVRERHSSAFLVAFLELHTFSSLNKDFLPEYASSLQAADHAVVFFSPKTLLMKKMPAVSASDIARAFEHDSIEVITSAQKFEERLAFFAEMSEERVLLLMSSGRFDGADLNTILQS